MHPFVAVMRRYAVDYTARGDLSVCPEIMVDDYRLHMGIHHLEGRDGPYAAAVQAQLDQFPTLGFTVHQVLTNGDRLALRFSEHGASVRHDGRLASWPGISTYHWDGSRLVECWVEQDYLARTRQLESGSADPVEPPAVDPWATSPVPADPSVEATARAWLGKGDLAAADHVRLDDGGPRVTLESVAVTIDDVFSAGSSAAFHVTHRGAYQGVEVVMGAAGILEVDGGSVASVRAITDRLGVSRQVNKADR
jgi:predicted ester cyclase